MYCKNEGLEGGGLRRNIEQLQRRKKAIKTEREKKRTKEKKSQTLAVGRRAISLSPFFGMDVHIEYEYLELATMAPCLTIHPSTECIHATSSSIHTHG